MTFLFFKIGVFFLGMLDLRNTIMATLAYYDIFDYPLTLIELYKYLINPVRIERNLDGVGIIGLEAVQSDLEKLVSSGKVRDINGYYALTPRARELFEMRMERQKIASTKYEKLLRLARWFQATPYLRGMFVSGSLSLDNSASEGDFDILVVTSHGRLYTCRFILSGLASILGVRRRYFESEAPDKFCFNHYLTEKNLLRKHESLYTAHTYAQLVPIMAHGNITSSFYSQNVWLNKFVYNFRPSVRSPGRSIRPSRLLRGIAGLSEAVLSGRLGEAIEKKLKNYQQKRISENPVSYEPGGRIIWTNDELEFHPHSFEAVVIAKYNKTLEGFGTLVPFIEKDSGLQ